MVHIKTQDQINNLVINDKFRIIAFNHFRNIYILHKHHELYFFIGLGFANSEWTFECTSDEIKHYMYFLPNLYIFDTQLEFMEWTYKITKDGK